MYTDDDLRAVFTALEREAPDPAATVTTLHRLRHRRTVRRRVMGIAAAAAATAALVTSSLTVPGLFDRTSGGATSPAGQPAAAHRELMRYTFAVDEIPGYRAVYRTRGKRDQRVWVFAGTSTERPYDVTVYAAGFDPHAQGGQPVDVNGRHGFYVKDLPCQCSTGDPVPSLAWEYAPGSWATVTGSFGVPAAGTQDILLLIARAVRFDRTTAVRLPFRIGQLPPGMEPIRSDQPQLGWANTLATPSTGVADISLAVPDGPQLSLTAASFLHPDLPVGQPDVAQSRLRPESLVASVNLGPFGMQLQGTGITADELLAIARSLTPAASITDEATWFDAETAIPGT